MRKTTWVRALAMAGFLIFFTSCTGPKGGPKASSGAADAPAAATPTDAPAEATPTGD